MYFLQIGPLYACAPVCVCLTVYSLFQQVVNGVVPAKRNQRELHEKERARMIDVLQRVLVWRNKDAREQPPPHLFDGLTRMVTNE